MLWDPTELRFPKPVRKAGSTIWSLKAPALNRRRVPTRCLVRFGGFLGWFFLGGGFYFLLFLLLFFYTLMSAVQSMNIYTHA